MPELPDVEGYRRGLTEHLPGARVTDVQVLDPAIVRNANAESFRDELLGCRFGRPERRGKWLLLPTDGPTLLIHSGMTGRPYFLAPGRQADVQPHDRLIVNTDAGDLHYADLRKLRGVWLVEATGVDAVIGEQGPDALGLSSSALRAALHHRRGALKAVLMNQAVVAGLGNMLSDEICWRARLHPARPATSLIDDELDRLHRVMQLTLRAAVRQGRIPRTAGWLSSVRDRDPAGCPRCGTTLHRTRIAGRTSIWCPRCQPEPATSRAAVTLDSPQRIERRKSGRNPGVSDRPRSSGDRASVS